ncbi:hypothetical protein EDB80DRAFT_809169 [Ilyonectria destructans]|nr:hypothetical protein EDB80DRAFT_809169 [Ilyonectria destructans]
MSFVRHALRFRDIDSLGEAASSLRNLLLSPRDITPAICYHDCNNAYKIALSQGKTSELCVDGSAFMAYFHTCTSCIEANSDASNTPHRDYAGPEFQQFVDYCNGDDSTPTTTIINSDIFISTVITVVNSSGKEQPSTVIVTTITTDEATSTTPCAICTPLIYTDPTGKVHTVMVQPGLKDLPKAQYHPLTLLEAVIVGPVVAVVVVIIVLLAALFFWRRQRPKKNISALEDPPQEEPKYEKAQLHSDCIPRDPRCELEGSVPPLSSQSPTVGEMTPNEVPAQEMPTSQKCLAETDETEYNTPRQCINDLLP